MLIAWFTHITFAVMASIAAAVDSTIHSSTFSTTCKFILTADESAEEVLLFEFFHFIHVAV